MPPPFRGAPGNFIIPFPLPFHVGTDICRIPRIARILRMPQTTPSRFVRRVLTPPEVAFAPPVVRMMWEAGSRGKAGCGTTDWRWGTTRKEESGEGEAKKGEENHAENREENHEEGALEFVEKQDGEKRKPKESIEFRRAVAFMAGRFAAKEAAFKAHPHLHLGFHDVLILSAQAAESMFGAPELPVLLDSLTGEAPVAIIRDDNKGRIQMAQISISHDWGYATAVCMGFNAENAASMLPWKGGETKKV
ncbi:hypothetical protein VTJ83DRAFT_4273 [Remersonia thermophila]|uniref:4'-phosphopantetheinyl transferase domain-containing protein n=1 Tax=Remersonia thermophila TaxID=72144 RepID=A0ABR4D9G3_9PEZI